MAGGGMEGGQGDRIVGRQQEGGLKRSAVGLRWLVHG